MKKLLVILFAVVALSCSKDLDVEDCDCGVVVVGTVGMTVPGRPGGAGGVTIYPPITVIWNCSGYQEQIKVNRNYSTGDSYCK